MKNFAMRVTSEFVILTESEWIDVDGIAQNHLGNTTTG